MFYVLLCFVQFSFVIFYRSWVVFKNNKKYYFVIKFVQISNLIIRTNWTTYYFLQWALQIWKCFDMLIRGANLGSEALLQQFGQFLRADISRSVLRFCVKLHSLVLWRQECMSVNFHDFWRCFDMLTRDAKLS